MNTPHFPRLPRIAVGAALMCLAAMPAAAQRRPESRDSLSVTVKVADAMYEQARNAIELGKFDVALEKLDDLISKYDHGHQPAEHRVDAAHYWKAYSEAKVHGAKEAMKTIEKMQEKFSTSRWTKDAMALELELKYSIGQTVSPDAQADEDLKLLALRGLMQSDPERALPMVEKVLAGNNPPKVKRNALFVLTQSRSPKAREIMLAAARNPADRELQMNAIHQLGLMRAGDDLVKLYTPDASPEIKRAVAQGLFIGGNATRLVELARAEKDPAMKRSLVQKLSMMKSPAATDYLLELLQ
jgi:hypothetical protein